MAGRPAARACARAIRAALVVAGLWAWCGAAPAAAATGDLLQKSGLEGCVGPVPICSPASALDGAQNVAISPDGTSVYVASFASSAVAVFDRAANGVLTQKPGLAGCVSESGSGCADGTALSGAASVAVSPDGKNVYVVAANSDALAIFDRAANGTLTQKPGGDGCMSETGSGGVCFDGRGLGGAVSVAVSPDNRSVYVASWDGAVAVFDRTTTGAVTQTGCISETGGACTVGRALGTPIAVAVSPDGTSVYVASAGSDGVAVFDRHATGTLTQKTAGMGCVTDSGNAGACTDGTALAGVRSVAVSPDGTSVYVVAAESAALATFDRSPGGLLSQKPGLASCVSESGSGCTDGTALAGAQSVAVSRDGASVYVASAGSSAVAVFDRVASGVLAQKPGLAGCVSETGSGCTDGSALAGAASAAVSPSGTNVYVVANAGDAVAVFDRVPLPTPSPLPRPPAPPPPAAKTRPLLSALRLSPSRFAAARRGPSIARRGASRVSYRVSEPGKVRFTIQRAGSGRRAGRRCVKTRRSNRRARRCTRYTTLRGSFAHTAKPGRNAFRFSGRLRNRKLAPGPYRLRAVATNAARTSSRGRYARFRIRRR